MALINNVISTTPDYLQGYVGGYPVNVPVGLLIPAVVQKGVVNGNQPVSYNPSTGIFSAAGATVSVSGTVPTLRIGATTAIPLDTAGNGKAMPLVEGQTISISADITPTIAAGAILSGVTVADYLSTGTGNLILTNFNARGDTFAAENGRLFTVTYYKQTSGAFAVVQKGNLLDVIAPTLVSATVANATPTRVDLIFSEAMNSAWSVFGAFAVAGHTVSGITQLTTTTGYLTVQAFVYGEAARTLSYTQPGTYNMQDVAGNLLANITALSVTNNVAAVPAFVAQSAPAGTIGVAYSYTFAATFTTSFAVASGTLPAGLTLNTSTGALTGTPTTAATSAFVISATGAGGTTNSTAQSVVVSAAVAASLTYTSLTPAAINFTSSTTPAFADYYILGQNNAGVGVGKFTRKNGANLLTTPTVFGNANFSGMYGQLTGVESFTDGLGDNAIVYAGSSTASAAYNLLSDALQSGLTGTAPAVNNFTRKLRIHGNNFTQYYLALSLADGSATFTPIALPVGEFLYEVNFMCASASSTLTWSIQKANAAAVLTGSKDFCINSITLQTA